MSPRSKPEPVQVIKQRRDGALRALANAVPYIRFLGIRFDREGDQITAHLPFQPMLIGNPMLPALHGGVTAAFLEVTALISLTYASLLPEIAAGRFDLKDAAPVLPKTINFGVDYLRSGQDKPAFARASVNRIGRRYASVQVEAWQEDATRPFALGSGRFLMAGAAA